MRKSYKKIGLAMALVASMAAVGCGKKTDSKTIDDNKVEATSSEATGEAKVSTEPMTEYNAEQINSMIDKFAGYCELGEYKAVEYTVKKTEVTDKMVKSEVDMLLSMHATSEKVMTGTAKDGDTVNIDYVGSIDGVEFPGGSSNGQGYDLTLGSGAFIPGMEEQMVGHDVGETFDVNVTFPEDYHAEDLAGKPAVFKVTINHIVDLKYPDYNDAFVASYTDAKTTKEYEANIKDNLIKQNEQSDYYANQTSVMGTVINGAKIPNYPEEDLAELVDQVIEESEKSATDMGTTLEDLVVTYYGMESVDAFRDYLMEQAKEYLKEKIVICAIAKAENMTVTEADIEDIKNKIMENNMMDKETVESSYTLDEFVYFALSDKVFNFVLENANPQ